jgi:hypothetical protein
LLLGLFYDREDGGYMFLQNFGWLSMGYTALYLRFVVCLTTPVQLFELCKSRIVRLFVDNEWEVMWKETIVNYFKNVVVELRKIGQNIRYLGCNLNPRLPNKRHDCYPLGRYLRCMTPGHQ